MKNNPTPWQISGCGEMIIDAAGYAVYFNKSTFGKIVECVNACSGMNDPVADVRELKLIVSKNIGEYLSDTSRTQGLVNYSNCATFKFKTEYSNFPFGHPARLKFTPVKVSWYELGEKPPIGTECEISNCDQQFEKVKILYMGTELCVCELDSHTDQHFHLSSVKFRPLQTEKQKIIEQIADVLPSSGFCYDIDETAARIYDQFVAVKNK